MIDLWIYFTTVDAIKRLCGEMQIISTLDIAIVF